MEFLVHLVISSILGAVGMAIGAALSVTFSLWIIFGLIMLAYWFGVIIIFSDGDLFS